MELGQRDSSVGRPLFDISSYFDTELKITLQSNTFPFYADFFLVTSIQFTYKNVGQYQKSH